MDEDTMFLDTALLFSFGAALAYAFADMIARFGLQHANPFVGSMIALVSPLLFRRFPQFRLTWTRILWRPT